MSFGKGGSVPPTHEPAALIKKHTRRMAWWRDVNFWPTKRDPNEPLKMARSCQRLLVFCLAVPISRKGANEVTQPGYRSLEP